MVLVLEVLPVFLPEFWNGIGYFHSADRGRGDVLQVPLDNPLMVSLEAWIQRVPLVQRVHRVPRVQHESEEVVMSYVHSSLRSLELDQHQG